MASYSFSILTPDGNIYDNEVESIVVPGEKGSFGVLAHHAPMIAGLQEGPLSVREPEGGEAFFRIGRAVLEVSGDHVIVLSAHASRVSSLEEAKTKPE